MGFISKYGESFRHKGIQMLISLLLRLKCNKNKGKIKSLPHWVWKHSFSSSSTHMFNLQD